MLTPRELLKNGGNASFLAPSLRLYFHVPVDVL
jgi:hypothetical protein